MRHNYSWKHPKSLKNFVWTLESSFILLSLTWWSKAGSAQLKFIIWSGQNLCRFSCRKNASCPIFGFGFFFSVSDSLLGIRTETLKCFPGSFSILKSIKTLWEEVGGEGHWFVWVCFGPLSAKTLSSGVQEYSWSGFPWLNPSFCLELSSLLLFLLGFRGGQAGGFLLGMAAGSQLDSLLLPSANAFF